jgi:predicted dehydrogenase/nucleoside-diphosphate-sugar epimerase
MTPPELSSTVPRVLRIGLIGAGKMGMHHLRAIRRIPNAIVVGIADPLVTRETFAGLLPDDARLVTDADGLLNDVHPDVVHIVTPPDTHASLAMRALHAGCHVYVEKPFTPTRAEASAVLELAAERRLLVCAGHQCLFERPAVAARETLPALGRLVHAESYFSFRMVRRTITPANQVRDLLPHAVYPLVDQLRLGTGLSVAPISVSSVEAYPDGDVYALLRLGDCTGILIVTLRGRPVEQYQHLVGTNGWMRADYIAQSATTLLGTGAGPGVLITPYRRAFQTLTGATAGFSRLIFGGNGAYAGLELLIERFYQSIMAGAAPPIAPRAILDTVHICERIGTMLADAERAADLAARDRLVEAEHALPPAAPDRMVVVTGGTGLLGRRVAEELRYAGIRVLMLARRMPRWTARVPGVDYTLVDLAAGVDPSLLKGAAAVVHCAAETAGGKSEHERNSIGATRNMLEAAARAGVTRFVHVSSLAVLKPGSSVRRPLDEHSPVDGGLERGPYVWGKAESELFVRRRGAQMGVDVKIVRLGPLVDYRSFQAPGRLGRELGPWFIAIGGKRTPLSVCDVGTAARVLRSYVQDFPAAPPMLNLVETPAPTRGELAARVKADRPDLRFFWIPATLLRLASPVLKLAQRVALGSEQPVDIYGAFASEYYRTELAAAAIAKAGETVVRAAPEQPVPA